MKPHPFGFITFRNILHFYYFIASLCVLVVALLASRLSFIGEFSEIVPVAIGAGFVVISIDAVRVVFSGISSNLFSRSCIWWNLLLALLCFLAVLI